MAYRYIEGVGVKRSKRRVLWLLLPVIGIVGGAYMLSNVLWTALPPTRVGSSDKIERQTSNVQGDRVYIPKIRVDVSFARGDVSALESGAWWRKPENGNPRDGGNFVLSAHRFELGLTPQATRAKSPFYHIDRLQPGDKIFVDYEGERYEYRVTRKYQVPRTAIEIEEPSEEPKLTLYSCDIRGEAAGREVVEAVPVGVAE